MKMGWSSIRNACKLYLHDNNSSKTFIHHNRQHHHQQWKTYSSIHAPRQLIIKTRREPKSCHRLYAPPSPRSFSSSNHSNLKTKVGFVGWYLGKLDSYPAATKTITTSFIYAASDLTAQMVTSSSMDALDIIRTLRMAGYGFLFLGPSQHLWFNTISKALPKRDIPSTLKKIFLGQAIYGPANTALFFSYNAALQGENGDEISARLKRDLVPTLVNGLLYWPICDFATYKFVPVHLQPLVNSACAYLWTIYLTYMANLKKVNVT